MKIRAVSQTEDLTSHKKSRLVAETFAVEFHQTTSARCSQKFDRTGAAVYRQAVHGEGPMKFQISAVLVLLLASVSSHAQAVPRSAPPYPPEGADKTITNENSKDHGQKHHVDTLELQREASELSDLAKTLPSDIGQVSQGLLPKDVIEKLKKIEKLSKHLRGELAP